MKFILVHIGKQLPKHVSENVDSLLSFGFDVHFVSNECNLKNINKDAELTSIESLGLDEVNYKTNKTGSAKHDEFLTKTSLRFLVISEYAKRKEISNFFHVENDVFVLDKSLIYKTSETFLKTKYKMSLVMDCSHRAVPSIIWFRDFGDAVDLWNFISKEVNKTDMELLADYFNINRETVANLPIVPSGYFQNSGEIDYSNFYEELNCIFDGAAIGQYLYGVDDGNRGYNSKGFVNETCIFNPSDFSYRKDKNKLLSYYQNKAAPIANIHMHCKESYES